MVSTQAISCQHTETNVFFSPPAPPLHRCLHLLSCAQLHQTQCLRPDKVPVRLCANDVEEISVWSQAQAQGFVIAAGWTRVLRIVFTAALHSPAAGKCSKKCLGNLALSQKRAKNVLPAKWCLMAVAKAFKLFDSAHDQIVVFPLFWYINPTNHPNRLQKVRVHKNLILL
jgi:hypothetical protein